MRLTTTQLSRLFFVAVLLMLAVASCLNMSTMDDSFGAGALERYAPSLTWVVWLAFFSTFLLPGYRIYRPSPPIIWYTLFLLWTLVPTFLSGQKGMAYNILWINLPLLVLLATYYEMRNHGGSRLYHLVFVLMVVMFVVQYARILQTLTSLGNMAHLVVAYYSMYMLPLALLCKSRLLKAVLMIVVIVAIMTCLKRAGVVALILGLLTYMVLSLYVSDKLRTTHIISGVLLLACFGGLFFAVGSMGEETVWERFANIGDDNGSGRTVVWEVTRKLLSKLDIGSLLVGEGYNAVQGASPLSLSAHNDFLEITYDYGIIGIVLYGCAIVATLWTALKMTLKKSPYAPSLVMMLIIYLILSLISHIAIYFWMSIVMLTIGYLIGNYERDAGKQ